MLNKIKKVATFILTLGLMISVITPNRVIASENQYEATSLKKYEDLRIIQSEELRTDAVNKFNSLFQNGKIEYSEEYFDFDNIKIAEMNGEVYATISKNDSVLSTVTIPLNTNENFYVENYFYEKDGNFWIKTKQDGEVISDVDSEIQFVNNDEILQGIRELNDYAIQSQQRGLNVSCFLAVSGAGATVSGLIAKVCGTPCVLAPPTCIVCLGGIVVVGGGSIAADVWKCWE
ncbi:hypothetical protein [Dolosigranulum savutiense]|uniref:Uncharacterized protein n=1 Tax=Dolosigranulum savutiense TaxID=3110288 RepID=A0AB74TVF4_9LACT